MKKLRRTTKSPLGRSYFKGRIQIIPEVKISFVCPLDYDHKKQMENFVSAHRGEMDVISKALNDINYDYIKYEIIPGQKYFAYFYPIIDADREDCVAFQDWKESLEVGPQGVSLILSLKKRKNFPRDKFVIHFDDDDDSVMKEYVILANVDVTGRYSALTFEDLKTTNKEASNTETESASKQFDDKYCLLVVKEAN